MSIANEVTLIAAFLAGLATFFAPCTFVTLPNFLSYIVYQATDTDVIKTGSKYRIKVFLSSVIYVIGFLLVFTILGLTASGVGAVFHAYKDLFTHLGALAMIIFGIIIIGGERIKQLNFMYQERKVALNPGRFGNGPLLPFMIGATSAFAWTPCIGPILGSILFLAGTAGSAAQGGLLLFVYGLGINLPFLILALTVGSARGFVKRFAKYSFWIHKLSAILLIVMGILILTGVSDMLFGELLRLAIKFGYKPI